MKIPLPTFEPRGEVRAHSYPFAIAFVTHEFLQGTLFMYTIADMAAGDHVRQSGNVDALRKRFEPDMLEEWDLGWKLVEKYGDLFEKLVTQNALIAMTSQWDWYVRRLGNFVEFSRDHVASPSLNSTQKNNLHRLERRPIVQQIETLGLATGADCGVDPDALRELKEMNLVRNLGMHNRWEVDRTYLQYTQAANWEEGEVRFFTEEELQGWHAALIKTVTNTSVAIAARYVAAPSYPA